MPKGDKLIEDRLKKIIEDSKPPVPIIPSRLDRVAMEKRLKGKPKRRIEFDRRDFLLGGSLFLLGVSVVKLLEAFANPVSNIQNEEGTVQDAEIEISKDIFEILSDREEGILRETMAAFYHRFRIQDPGLKIVDSQYKDGLVEIYELPNELQLDMELIRANAAKSGLDIDIYFRFILLESLSATLQTPGGVMLPDRIDAQINGEKLLGYKGFGALVRKENGDLDYLAGAERAFRSAFAKAVDPSLAEISSNKEAVIFVELLLNHYGISIEEALDLNRGHGLDHLLLRMFRGRTRNENGDQALTEDDIELFLAFMEEANNIDASGEELFARYLRLDAVEEQ